MHSSAARNSEVLLPPRPRLGSVSPAIMAGSRGQRLRVALPHPLRSGAAAAAGRPRHPAALWNPRRGDEEGRAGGAPTFRSAEAPAARPAPAPASPGGPARTAVALDRLPLLGGGAGQGRSGDTAPLQEAQESCSVGNANWPLPGVGDGVMAWTIPSTAAAWSFRNGHTHTRGGEGGSG